MAETIGAAIIEAIAAAAPEVAEATVSAAEATYLGVSGIEIVGATALLAGSIGLQYALMKTPGVPKPEDGSQPISQAIPPRQRGYGRCRLAGYYMLFEAADVGGPPANSFDVCAFHSGRVEQVLTIYLSDDEVATTPALNFGGDSGLVTASADGAYGGGRTYIWMRLGADDQPQIDFGHDPIITGVWTPAHIGKGIAHFGLACGGFSSPQTFSQNYPRNLPAGSVVALCSPIWDPREPGQSATDESTWRVRYNPVLQLVDYITRADGGMGQDLDIVLPGATLQQIMIEADLCDAFVDTPGGGSEARYQSHGWFRYDTAPEDVINSLLSTCDGWLCEAGDGTLALTVGVYREPSELPLTERHILGWTFSTGKADEEVINVLNVSFTDPSQKYVPAPRSDARDEDSISELGIERPKPLSLTWVQSGTQADRLAQRALTRLNPKRSGTLVTTLYGLRYLGKRWVKVQYPFIADLANCVVEIQPSPKIDLVNGQVTFIFNIVDVAKLATDSALNPASVIREDNNVLMREDGALYFREAA